ncbi:ATPase [Aureococcus anophagefferens]|nr:ATPase [Aureococcus anophagefferens]
MAASYRVTALDLLRTQASSEEDNRKAVARYYGGALLLAHVVDVCSAVGLLVAYTDGHWRALVAPLLRLDFAFRKELTDMLALALLRAVLFPALTVLAVRFGRAPYANAACCGCGRKKEGSTRASDASGGAYVALGGPTTPARAAVGDDSDNAAEISARLADEENSANKALAQFRKHCFLGLIFVCSTFTQVYVGMKVNAFDSVLFTNVMVYIARELVKELTRDEGLFLPKVHAHPLVFDADLCRHWCDLCSTPIRRGGAWRCKLCDFDMCVPCASRKDAATVGENVLRSDTGARVESDVSSSTYLRRAIGLASKQAPLLALAMALLASNSGLALALPKYQGRIIDQVVRGQRKAFTRAVATYLYLMIAQGVCSAMYRAAFAVVSRTILYTVRTTLFRSVIRQDTAFYDGTTSGHLTSRLTNDAQVMMAPIDASLASLLYNVIMLFGGITMCFTTAWAEANAVATEALAHVRTVKAFVTERSETAKYEDACGEALRLGIRDAMGFGVTSALTGYLDLGTGVLILWYGGLIVLNKSEGLTIGELVTFQLYWTMMNSSYQNLQGLVTSFTRSAAAAEKVFSLIDSLPDINEDDGAAIDWDVQGVLSGVDLGIDAKSVCALVGRSGGGKSTIISLLMRFYDVRAGSLKLDGRDVRGLNVRDYRQLFGIVAQDTPLFARSILKNVAYGYADTDDRSKDLDKDPALAAAVVAAAKEAHAHDFIADMKDGYATRVGERGGRLSGGQRQRVAISRIFLREPRIILLDEATSALDEDSQAAVQKSLDALIKRGGSTVVLVAHRLSTVMNADKICVVDGGRVAESGTHEGLIDQKGIYASLQGEGRGGRHH